LKNVTPENNILLQNKYALFAEPWLRGEKSTRVFILREADRIAYLSLVQHIMIFDLLPIWPRVDYVYAHVNYFISVIGYNTDFTEVSAVCLLACLFFCQK